MPIDNTWEMGKKQALKQKTILFCPLDWGLGHASRDILIIQKLLDTGKYKIIIGADNAPYHLLKTEFPDLQFLRFPSFSIRYSSLISLSVKITLQLPKIFYWINKEHRLLKRIISQHGVDIVISDNRYGLWSKKVHTVIISHQINIFLPDNLKWTESLVNLKIRKWLKKFDQCWIPDIEGENNLAGKLSQPEKYSGNIIYIGPLSRFQLSRNQKDSSPAKQYEVLAILSGPEPQRSTLENILIRQFRKKDTQVLIVRGIPWQKKGQTIYGNISLVSHLPSELLYSYITTAKYIICRAGYSSIMDLAILNKPAILIPTPGQAEQEYLAQSLHARKFFYKLEQKNLDFEKAFNEISEYHPRLKITGNDFLDQALEKLERI